MPNIIDYLNWRGDLSFKQSKLNEVDKIILARFSNMPFSEIELQKKDTIGNIALKMSNLEDKSFIWGGDKEFINAIGKTKRYKDLKVTDYLETKDLLAEKQFAAITIWLPNRLKYVSFRGTDTSLVGWKEDFNMSFMKDIPAQKEALDYLNKIGEKYRDKLIVGGHSKGGNVSIYASTKCKSKIKRRILEVINADGPGFNEEVIKSKEYLQISERINTYIPQSSIIGRLLEHEENYEIVFSTQKGILQHDMYSWQVDGRNLVRIPELTNNSQLVNKAVRNWLQNTTPKQRENFINVIYEILLTTEVADFTEFETDTLKKIAKVIKSYRNIEKEDRKEIEEMIKLIFQSIVSSLKNKNQIEENIK